MADTSNKLTVSVYTQKNNNNIFFFKILDKMFILSILHIIIIITCKGLRE